MQGRPNNKLVIHFYFNINWPIGDLIFIRSCIKFNPPIRVRLALIGVWATQSNRRLNFNCGLAYLIGDCFELGPVLYYLSQPSDLLLDAAVWSHNYNSCDMQKWSQTIYLWNITIIDQARLSHRCYLKLVVPSLVSNSSCKVYLLFGVLCSAYRPHSQRQYCLSVCHLEDGKTCDTKTSGR